MSKLRFAWLLPLVGALFGAGQGCASKSGTATTTPSVSEPARAYVIVGSRDPRPQPKDHPVILVTLDGVRYQEVFGGADASLGRQRGMVVPNPGMPEKLMPRLHRVIQTRGIALGAPGKGHEVTASGPNFVSLPGYHEMFTGAPSLCQSNDCPQTRGRTIVDEIRSVVAKDRDVAVFSSWEPISRAATSDLSSMVLSTGREHVRNGAELVSDRKTAQALWLGANAKPFPSEREDYRPDEYTGRLALRYLAAKQPKFMFVGLGDADEYGHKNDYYGYLRSLKEADAFIGDLFATLDKMGERGKRTVVLITADHGREKDFKDHGGDFPESGRVWLVAAGGDVPPKGIIPATRPISLSDLVPTIRGLMALPEGPTTGQAIAEITESASGDPRLALP